MFGRHNTIPVRFEIAKFFTHETNLKLQVTFPLNNNNFFEKVNFWRLTVQYLHKGYAQHYLFWCLYLGWAYLFVGATWWGQFFFVPSIWVVSSFVFVFSGLLLFSWTTARVVSAGVKALWASLVTLVVVGATCCSQINFNFDIVCGPFVIDTLNVPFVLLTVTLTPLVILASLDSIRGDQIQYYWLLVFLTTGITLCFCVSDFLTFFNLSRNR